MGTPAIAHFGTTIIEAAPPDGMAQEDVPLSGALGRTLAFLETLGFEPATTNMYPGIGRQFIWSRGAPGDVDYVEQDNFTSYVAEARPASDVPRVGDTIFRLTHRQPLEALDALLQADLVQLQQPQSLDAWRAGDQAWLLLTAPNGQCYEFGASQPTQAANHCVYVWTQDRQLDAVSDSFAEHFDMQTGASEDFHSLGKVLYLSRDKPGVTIGLLHAPTAGTLAPRWSEDIFSEAGYAHFRMAAPDKTRTLAFTRQAFEDAGDVSFVYFRDSYLELVQA